MSIKSKVLAAAAALTVVGGVAAGTLAAGAAGAATPSCGPSCIDIFSKQFGTFHHPAFVLDVQGQAERVGQRVILFRSSNSDPAEDFTISAEGPVSDFFQAGMVSAAVNLHYGCNWSVAQAKCTNKFPDDYAVEIEYAPFGVDSGLCAGVRGLAASRTKVSLQPCGISAGTLWITDTVDSCITNPLYVNEVPAINGSDTNFSHPFVLTYPAGRFPTDKPRPQLFTSNLSGFSQSGNALTCGGGSIVGVNSDQLWSAVTGVLH